MIRRRRATRPSAGTTAMILGMLGAAVGSYVFQVVGGRALGADAFAPVTVIWTLLFLGLTVFLMPIEQLIIRRLTLSGGDATVLADSWRVIVVVVMAATAIAIGFVVAVRSSLLADDPGFVVVTAFMFPLHAAMLIGRGLLAGRGRFVAYGVSVGLDAGGKAGGAVVVALLGFGPVAFCWALTLSTLLVLLVRPLAPVDDALPVLDPTLPVSDHRFMIGFLVATAASQTILAAGPLVVGALGAGGAAISIFFVTTTLFRGPMSASYTLLARILPGLTRRAVAGDHVAVNRLVKAAAVGGTAMAVAGGVVAAGAGPAVVEFLYGSEFRPSAWLAALAASGVVIGIVGLATTQVLVGRGETDKMAVSWLVALGTAAMAILIVRGDPSIRVAAGFLAGEVAALAGLTIAALSVGRRPAGG